MKQSYHTDFPVDRLNPLNAKCSYSAILCLQNNTRFYGMNAPTEENPNYQEILIILNKGQLLIFRGDYIHAGADYPDSDNVRLLFYMEEKKRKKGETRVPGLTYFLKKSITDRLVKVTSNCVRINFNCFIGHMTKRVRDLMKEDRDTQLFQAHQAKKIFEEKK